MSLPRFSVTHPITTTMIFLALVGFGFISLSNLGMELYPDISLPSIVAYTISPGVNPHDVEDRISRPIEDAVSSVSGIDGIESTSYESVSMVTIKFTNGTDMDKAITDIREAINTTESNFPDGTEKSQLYIYTASMLPSLRVNIYTETEGINLKTLLEDKLVPELQRIRGVASADLFGGKNDAIMIYLDLDQMNSLNISLSSILQAFQGENTSLPGGVIRTKDQNISLRTSGSFESLEDIGNVAVGSRGDVPIYLKNVATIDMAPEPQEEFVYVGSKEAVRLNIMKQPGYNTVNVNKAVLDALERLKPELPPSIKMEIVEDQAIQVQAAVGGVADSAWQGGLLAILILLFFLRNIRSTLVIATSIPLSVIATFTLMNLMSITLNITSMLGITLAIGMFVDNAIVVLESIYRKMLLGYDKKEAAILGAEEVSSAVTASTLTTLAVFVPMLMVTGLAGVLFRDLSLTISFALAISLLSALTFIPVLSSKLLKVKALPGFSKGVRQEAPALLNDENENFPETSIEDISLADVEVQTPYKPINAIASRIQKILVYMDKTYERIITWSLNHVVPILIGTVLLLVLSVSMIFLMGMEFLPETDDGLFSVTFETKLGATYEFTNEKAIQIEKIIKEEAKDTIITISSRIGDGGSNYGETNVRLLDKEDRNFTIWDIADRVDRRITAEVLDINYSVDIEGMAALATMASGTSSPISIEIKGNNIDQLFEQAQKVRSEMLKVPGLRNIQISYKTGKPELFLKIKRQEAVSLGLSPLEIASTIRTAYAGYTVSNYTADGDDYDIRLILNDTDRNRTDRIRSLFFINPRGEKIALESVVDISEENGPVSITRKDRARVIFVRASLTKEYALNQVSGKIDDLLAKISSPPGVEMVQSGSGNDMNESFASLGLALIAAIALVYMVMAAQFEDLLNPLIIMFSIPFALIGLILALLVTNTTFNILSFTGAILLAGIVVNNAIVLLDYIGILRKRGMSLRDAIIHGGKTRLKPIFMSVSTTILGLLPMALGLGAGAELRSPMARAVIGGLLSSTLITLVLIPCIYWLIENHRKPKIQDL